MRRPEPTAIAAALLLAFPALGGFERREVILPSMGVTATGPSARKPDDMHSTTSSSRIEQPVLAGAGSSGALPVGTAFQPDAFQSNAFKILTGPALGSPPSLLSSTASSA